MAATAEFDAIVVGSGLSGGWAAKELTERGLKVLMIERGPKLEHVTDYTTENTPPWEMPFRGYSDPQVLRTTKRIQRISRANEWALGMYVDDDVDIYDSPPESGFLWVRGYHTGGKSVMWGRHSYRMGPENFEANAKDGHGVDWPIRYNDLAPWYDHVEEFIGINGTVENLPSIPDGKFQPSMGLNAGEQKFADVIRASYSDRRAIPGRTANLTQQIGARLPCQHRNQCNRGCSFGSYFSTQSSTLPAAEATGRLTLAHDTIVEAVEYDPATKRASGVRVVDAKTGLRSVVTSRIVFLCASAYDSVAILLRSASEALPGGLGSSGGALGAYVMDHAWSVGASATAPGLENAMYIGRKPNGIIIPRFVNVGKQETDFYRGYSYQGGSNRQNWGRGGTIEGIGAELKQSLRQPGRWTVNIGASIETLPRKENAVTLDASKRDKHGLPVIRIDMRYSDNERKAAAHAHKEAVAMLSLLGGQIVNSNTRIAPPGTSIHDMGGACMGRDPRTSVTNAYNQVHDAPNVFVTDGAAMSSTGDRNPSLSFMALTARASAAAVSMLKEGAI
jgi:choline dehydrogenase-like flavoprotein